MAHSSSWLSQQCSMKRRWTSADATPARNSFAPPVNNAEARAERVLRVLALLFSGVIGKATRMI
jgi:hypothetical protein